MGALQFSLPLGLPVVGAAAGATTNLVGVTQADLKLGAFRATATTTATNAIQPDATLTGFTIAGNSVFCSNAASFPLAAMSFLSQSKDELIDVTLAAGTSVAMTVVGGAAVAGYDVGASIQTDPIGPEDLDPGQAPGDTDLTDLALLYPLGQVALGGAGVTVQLQALCNRTCRLGKLFLVADTLSYGAVTSVLVGGVEQLAQSNTVGIPVSHFAPNSTMQAEWMDIDTVITPGETVSISINDIAGVAGNIFGGIYCLPID
jgi:hypothetical protein